MRTRKLNLITAVMAISLIVGGCGGGGTGGGGDAEAALRARFIHRANAICERANRAQFAAMGKAGTSSDPSLLVGAERAVLLPPIQSEAEEIAELRAPPGDEREVTAIVRGIEGAVAKAEEDPVNDLEQPFLAVDKQAAKYGLFHCVGLIIGKG